MAADVDPDNASILVCGGGGVALSVTRKLKDMGSWVWMLQRKEDRRKDIEGMMAIVAKGDALSKDDIEKVFASALMREERRGWALRRAVLHPQGYDLAAPWP
jgi:shikimate 5-dehydrogenase